MKALKICLFLLGCSLISACHNNNKGEPVQQYLGFSLPELDNPDSLLSAEQLRTKRKLFEVISANYKIKDNRAVFEMSRDEFLSKGLSENYYDMCIKSVNDMNTFLDKEDSIGRRMNLELLRNALQKMQEEVKEK